MIPRTAQFLKAELARLDLLLRREILRLRAAYQLSLDEFRGLYVSDEQVDAHLASRRDGADGEVAILTEQAAVLRERNRVEHGDAASLTRLAHRCDLDTFSEDVVLLAAAVDHDPKYESVYAYLNNDITRKWPTRHLALRVMTPAGVSPHECRDALDTGAPLLDAGIIAPVTTNGDHRGWPSLGFALSAVARDFLLESGHPAVPSAHASFVACPPGWEHVEAAQATMARVRRVAESIRRQTELELPVFPLLGRRGSGRRASAAAIAHELDLTFLEIDVAAALRAAPAREVARPLALFRRLHRAAVYLRLDEEIPVVQARELLDALRGDALPTFVALKSMRPWTALLDGIPRVPLRLADPDCAERRATWLRAIEQRSSHDGADLDALSDRFVLNSGEVHDAVALAGWLENIEAPGANGAHGERLFEAARRCSKQSLGQLAQRVPARHAWEDLVLPPATRRRLHNVARAVANRRLVYSTWGFGGRSTNGLGLKILFSGSSGTGKTMAAGVIAHGLELDLFKIDLSTVVSKYIGETEKNLDRIFEAARSSNAVLFFDEADAMFGKRSEVKDAHDRYANIEVGYLLQKLEEHDGVVILASNLSGNIDDAFSRRMHYVIEFPLPDAKLRERLWREMFPSSAPLDADVDFTFLARQFELAGGDIRNVALDAAFLAAENGHVIRMTQIVQALERQLAKQGRVRSAAQFGPYYRLIDKP